MTVDTTPDSEVLTGLFWALSELEMPALMLVTVETAPLTEVLRFEIAEFWVLSELRRPC